MKLETTAQVRAAVMAIPREEWPALSLKSGVPKSTLEKIAYGITSRSNYDSTLRLVGVLKLRAGR